MNIIREFLLANQLRHGIIAIGEFRQNIMIWFRQLH